MKTTNDCKLLIRLVATLAALLSLLASSSGSTATILQTPDGQANPLETVKLITSTGIENFVKDLNDNGKLGYRLEKSLSYGGEGPTQSYAAVLVLDAPNKFEYDWMSSPDKKLLEPRLNFQAKKGLNFTTAYALTYCSGGTSEEEANPTSVESLIFRLHKGDAFLLERSNGETEQTKEYKVFSAKVRLGDSAEKDIQAAVDASALEGFRPVKILFARHGLLDFRISVLTERNLTKKSAPTTEYRFLKKTSGLPKDMNALATQGFRFMAGRRLGMMGLVLMEKRASDATTYVMIEAKKYAKEFDKTIALGNSYQALMMGDLTCGSTEAENERLVFAQSASGEKHEYKIKRISFTTTGNADPESLSELRRLRAEGYQVRDLFYSGGLNVIFEK